MVRRVAGLHQCLAKAEASNEAAVKQAKSVSDHCEQLMEEVEKLKVGIFHISWASGFLRLRFPNIPELCQLCEFVQILRTS